MVHLQLATSHSPLATRYSPLATRHSPLAARTPVSRHCQEERGREREKNNWKGVLYAGRAVPRSSMEAAAPRSAADAATAPPPTVVSKVFGAVQSAEEQDALLRHMQLIKHGIAFGQTEGQTTRDS